ncbi:hypothetical protein BJV78DRAFT_1283805 [Lactifluus subvellereus]|nr:hypothetical protein BJV78DRAFT_1283805 [Lactifluus subvellereus]
MHSVLNTFFQEPVSGEEKERCLQERIAAERVENKDRTQYLLTVEQMIQNDYPVPSYLADVVKKPDRWIETPQAATGLTQDGKALTRVCVIDFTTNKAEYDEFVKPPSPITDYLIRFSGITAAALAPITTTLADVQAHLAKIITPSTILLGHSLGSDLRVLQLAHPQCIDTVLIFHRPRERLLEPGLVWFTRKWLGHTIQDRPEYGDFRTDYEPILARIVRSHSRRHGPNGEVARTAIVDHGNPGAWHGVTPKASVDGLGTGSPENPSSAAENENDTDNPQPQPTPEDKVLFSTVAKLNDHLTTLHAAPPARTAFILLSGHSDPRKISVLAARRAEYRASQDQSGSAAGMSGSASAVGWRSADLCALEEAVVRTRMGLLFVAVKT